MLDMSQARQAQVKDEADAAERRILGAAAVVIERHGWIRGEFEDCSPESQDRPAVCVLGAIAVAAGMAPGDWFDETHPGYRKAERAGQMLGDYLGLPPNRSLIGRLSCWNDDPGRDADQVIAALRQAGQTTRLS